MKYLTKLLKFSNFSIKPRLFPPKASLVFVVSASFAERSSLIPSPSTFRFFPTLISDCTAARRRTWSHAQALPWLHYRSATCFLTIWRSLRHCRHKVKLLVQKNTLSVLEPGNWGAGGWKGVWVTLASWYLLLVLSLNMIRTRHHSRWPLRSQGYYF